MKFIVLRVKVKFQKSLRLYSPRLLCSYSYVTFNCIVLSLLSYLYSKDNDNIDDINNNVGDNDNANNDDSDIHFTTAFISFTIYSKVSSIR